MSSTIYTANNLRDALLPTTVRGVYELPLEVPICVQFDEWDACRLKIQELCCEKWCVLRTYKRRRELATVLYSRTYHCHRSGEYPVRERSQRPAQKPSKKCGCSGSLKVTQYASTPDIMEFVLQRGHSGHVPGERSDRRTLPLTTQAIDLITRELRQSGNCSNIRISIMRQLDDWIENNDGNPSLRPVNYEDVYNRMLKIKHQLYEFHRDDMTSLGIWLNRVLPLRNYNIFTGNLQAYSSNTSLFALGFQSPDQKRRMGTSISFCLDATHGISSKSMDVMYTLIIRDRVTGKGYPSAYMFTNDHSVGSINQWMVHLRDSSNFRPQYVTIDCSVPEVNAIKAAFPSTFIHYCGFHVMQAWKRQLKQKVRLDGSHTARDVANLREEMLISLRSILVAKEIDEFHTRVACFQEEYSGQYEFLDYFEESWIKDEETMTRWSQAYLSPAHYNMFTNNYIESWHNQLKTKYFQRLRNRRLDRLVFILTHHVEYFNGAERERISINDGRMGPIENQQARRLYLASIVAIERMPTMITNPDGDNSSCPSNPIGTWSVRSFSNENSLYRVKVNDDTLIESCTCDDFQQRLAPCKHMYILKRYTGLYIQFHEVMETLESRDDEPDVNMDLDAIAGDDDDDDDDGNIAEVQVDHQATVEELDVAVEAVNVDAQLQSISSMITSAYHQREDLEAARRIPNLSPDITTRMETTLREYLQLFEELRNQHPRQFRRLNRQQH